LNRTCYPNIKSSRLISSPNPSICHLYSDATIEVDGCGWIASLGLIKLDVVG
jgi:hypothetical protein